MINNRHLYTKIKNHFDKYKQAIILLGARQIGKTTILKKIFPNAKYLLVDEEPVKRVLETYSISSYKQILGKSKTVIIDEAHLLSNPGKAIKIIYDQIEDIQIILTGSSSLQIKNRTTESLAGRQITYKMFPLTWSEYLVQNEIEENLNFKILNKIVSLDDSTASKLFNQKEILNNILIYGLYPETIQIGRDENYLINLAESAIFKDILELNLIDDRSKALNLLKLLAYQIGNLVNYSEIGRKIGLSTKTVQRYLDIFEQSYILFRIYPFSKDKRSEIGKTPKIYFSDLGLRNALINNFDSVNIRGDAGAMFENFIISEVRKSISYSNSNFKINYWRLKSDAEVDLVLSNQNKIIGCEIKYNKGRISRGFTNRYPQAETHVLTSENFY